MVLLFLWTVYGNYVKGKKLNTQKTNRYNHMFLCQVKTI